MPNTTNFNFPTPADTDLVKDGASAIRSLGNSIDTAFVDLKGGTTGQILSKASNTDLDYTWITNDVGDITAVTAGTGISGGGTSGAVTITNSMATEITAAGDIIVGTGSGTFDNLPIGTTGQVLTADTTVSPYKVKWATASGGSYPTFGVYKNANQTISANTWTKVTWSTENWDSDNCFASDKFTPNKSGKYVLTATLRCEKTSSGSVYFGIYKNGAVVNYVAGGTSQPTLIWLTGSPVATANGSTDYFEVYVYMNGGAGGTVYGNSSDGSANTYFQGYGVAS